nr:flagellin [Parvularcula mediterranea]
MLTNPSAKTALRTLRVVQAAGDRVRTEISTGLKVQGANDNPAFFMVSSRTRGDIAVINGFRDNLVVSQGAIKAAEAGLNQLNDLLLQITDMIPVSQNGIAVEELETVYDDLLDQMRQTIEASGFQGTNLLKQAGSTTSVIGLNRTGSEFDFQTLSMEGGDFLRKSFDGLVESGNNFVFDAASSAFSYTSAQGTDTSNTVDRENSWEIITDPLDPLAGWVRWDQDTVGNDIYFTQAQVDANSPRMDFRVQVVNPGRYYVNVQGFGTNGTSDSIHLGIDGVKFTDNGGVDLPSNNPTAWGGRSTYGGDVFVDIAAPGIYTINIWGREDGAAIKTVEFTDDPANRPNGYTPALTPIGGSDLPYFTHPLDGEERRAAAGLMELVEAVNPEAMRLNPDQAMLVIDSARAKIARYQAQVGAYDATLTRQTSYLANLEDGLTGSVAALVEADLEEASSRLQALQVQEQLAVQGLTVANGRGSVILSLFR